MERIKLIEENGSYYLHISSSLDDTIITRVEVSVSELRSLKSRISSALN